MPIKISWGKIMVQKFERKLDNVSGKRFLTAIKNMYDCIKTCLIYGMEDVNHFNVIEMSVKVNNYLSPNFIFPIFPLNCRVRDLIVNGSYDCNTRA